MRPPAPPTVGRPPSLGILKVSVQIKTPRKIAEKEASRQSGQTLNCVGAGTHPCPHEKDHLRSETLTLNHNLFHTFTLRLTKKIQAQTFTHQHPVWPEASGRPGCAPAALPPPPAAPAEGPRHHGPEAPLSAVGRRMTSMVSRPSNSFGYLKKKDCQIVRSEFNVKKTLRKFQEEILRKAGGKNHLENRQN